MGGLNLYNYVEQDPISKFDPVGLQSMCPKDPKKPPLDCPSLALFAFNVCMEGMSHTTFTDGATFQCTMLFWYVLFDCMKNPHPGPPPPPNPN
jgi:hypothetical protein